MKETDAVIQKPDKEKMSIGSLALWIGRIVLISAAALLWIWLVDNILVWTNRKTAAGPNIDAWIVTLIKIAGSVLFGLILLFTARPILVSFVRLYRLIERSLANYSGRQILMGLAGLVLGLGLVLIVQLIFRDIPLPVTIVLSVVLGFIGLMLGARRMSEVFGGPHAAAPAAPAEVPAPVDRPLILDSSAIIDGRILDLAKTGFFDGALIVPAFILAELRHITDNPDLLKRNRGKRGLDVIEALRQEKAVRVVMDETDYEEGDADARLLRLAKERGGKIVTNDYNLNKIASLKEIRVFNINELANAIKPVVLPGEKLKLKLVKEGKESGQAVGYLADGTMIVVENGGKLLGQEVEATITTALQTAAGRIIFGRIM
ncbi:PIN/TRAM domain-containing protein [Clostridia bacterium]|nr:PIN/TRAM domain-containing protein [Clostridia bacterium]